jgi:hypothetical protein
MQKYSKKIVRLIGFLFVFLLIQFDVNASNRVRSVNAYQSGNLIIVDYELTQGANIELQVYINGQYTYSSKSPSGDVGYNIKAGKKRIVWDVLKDYDEFKYDNVQFKVYSYGKTYVPWSNFIMVNGGFTSLPDYSYGLTYALVKRSGFYISALSNFHFKFRADYVGNSDASVGYNHYYPLYTGEKEYTKLTATIGYIGRLGAPIYLYFGGGYGYRGLFYETENKEWVAIQGNHCIYHGGVGEIGLIGNIYGFSLSLGLSVITDLHNYYPEAKVGVGYCF